MAVCPLADVRMLLIPFLLLIVSCGGGTDGGTTPPPDLPPPPPIVSGTALGTGTLSDEGGALEFGESLQIEASPGALLDTISLKVVTVELPAPLPAGVRLAGQPVDISVESGADALEEPLTLTFTPSGPSNDPDLLLAIAHYDPETGRYGGTTIRDQDPAAGTITVETRSFSIFLPVELSLFAVPAAFTLPRFAPLLNGWSINNFGNYFAYGGNCLGMSAYCAWFFTAKPTENLADKYPGAAAPIVATRAHLSQSQYWGIQQHEGLTKNLTEVQVGNLERAFLYHFREPLIQTMYGEGRGHAGVAFGYDLDGFLVYDVSHKGQTQTIPWSRTSGFGSYGGFDEFAFIAQPSLGRNQDFAGLYTDAENGFRSDAVTIDSPTPDETLHERRATVNGSVSDASWNNVAVWANGARFDGFIAGGRFSVEVPVSVGESQFIVLAGVGIGLKATSTPASGVNSVTINGDFEKRPLLVTLRWNQGASDVDLFVYEPDGEVAWYGDPTTRTGGKFEFENVTGYGPEHYRIGSSIQTGDYRIRVHYYADGDATPGADQRITGRVYAVLDEGGPNQQYDSAPFVLLDADHSADGPEGAGPSWAVIGSVNVADGFLNLR